MASFKDVVKLGSGGFGEVWKCERDEDSEVFAKKILLDTTPEAIKRFQREVRILSKLKHPRIVMVVATHLGHDSPGIPTELRGTVFGVMVVFIATLIIAVISRDGQSNWLEGLQLISVYAIVALAAFFL